MLPFSAGRVSLVTRVAIETTGAVLSTVNSFEVPSMPMLPMESVATTATS